MGHIRFFQIANQHGVPITEKPVLFPYGQSVEFQGFFPPEQGADQHEQGGAGTVKVGDQGVDACDGDARMKEKIGGAKRVGLDAPLADALQNPQGSGADGANLFSRCPGVVDFFQIVSVDEILFRVHGMVADVFGFDGGESAPAYVEDDFGRLDSLLLEGLESAVFKVESGGGGGDGAGLPGIEGLIISGGPSRRSVPSGYRVGWGHPPVPREGR